jgi:hypothetical protein
MDNSWTKLRIEINNCIKDYNLKIEPLNINKWNEIEHKIINYFTETNDGLTWMWENKIINKFDSFAKQISDFNILIEIIYETINKEELLWFFVEDTLNYKTKYWGYEGKITEIIKLFKEIHLDDFYIVSKKLEWVIGQNHHDILFCFGEIKEVIELKIKEKTHTGGDSFENTQAHGIGRRVGCSYFIFRV